MRDDACEAERLQSHDACGSSVLGAKYLIFVSRWRIALTV